MNVYEKIVNFCDFEEGKAYVLLLIPRKKENVENTEKEKLGLLQRKIVQNASDVAEALEYFEDFTSRYPNIVFRLYITVNRRCLTKALFAISEKVNRMLKDLHFGNKEVFNRVTLLSSELKSTLCEKQCRDTKLFHFDVDYDNKTLEGNHLFEDLLKAVGHITPLKMFGKTLNGFTIVCDPFNPLLLKEWYPEAKGMNIVKNLVEIKPDSYLYLHVYNFNG